MKHLLSFVVLFFISSSLFATIWNVGPTRTYTYCSQVAPLVQAGDTIQIDNAVYINDSQVQWSKSNLRIEGVGGRPQLKAGSIIANDMSNGKGIFVISGSNVHVHNIEFDDAVVVDHNGAGIRQEGANLLVTNCKFNGNEMGILCGSISNCKTTVEFSEFVNGGSNANPGYQHNIYINHIDSFIFRYNYSHDAIAEGHELKSRANFNFIVYNRISNEQSVDSRTIDLPNGGTSVLVGNIIEQGANSSNSNLVGYGLEGLINSAPNKLFICNNTFINKKTSGSFVDIASGTDSLFVKNNIFAGAKTGGLFLGSWNALDSSNNLSDNSIALLGFVNAISFNYHLQANSIAKDAGVAISRTIQGYALKPGLMYKDTCLVESRPLNGSVDIGAFEYAAPSGIDKIGDETCFIFPNPSFNKLVQVKSDERILSAQICDMRGVILKEYKNIDSTSLLLDCNAFDSGVYFVLFKTVNHTLFKKILLQ